MSVSLPFSPNSRDFLAYQRLIVESASTRQVAEELEISQTRVRQIVRRVIHWVQQTLPQDTELDEAAQLRVARHITADRLERYYVEADRCWRQSGETKYANLALKVLNAQTKLHALPGTIEALAMDAILGPLPEEAPAPTSTRARSASEGSAAPITQHPSTPHSEFHTPHSSPPPLRDCSPATSSHPPSAPEKAAVESATPTPATPSATVSAANSAIRKAFLAPAHPREGEAPAGPVTELKITPESLGFTVQKATAKKRLSSRERRRLRRHAMS